MTHGFVVYKPYLILPRLFCKITLSKRILKGKMDMKKVERPKKSLMFYYMVVLLVMILLNTLLFPRLMR